MSEDSKRPGGLPDEGVQFMKVDRKKGTVEAYTPGTEPQSLKSRFRGFLGQLRPRSRDGVSAAPGEGESTEPNITPKEDHARVIDVEKLKKE